MVINDPEILTKEQRDWFGNRMDESPTSRVLVPTRLYDKFRKITNREHLSNDSIKDYLIRFCYER